MLPLLLFAAAAAAIPPQDWSHGWDTLQQAQFADFGYAPYSDSDATFLASHYAILSVEKCSGANNTEEVVWANARLVKARNPNTKMVVSGGARKPSSAPKTPANAKRAPPTPTPTTPNPHKTVLLGP
jgi:hypothetical protein